VLNLLRELGNADYQPPQPIRCYLALALLPSSSSSTKSTSLTRSGDAHYHLNCLIGKYLLRLKMFYLLWEDLPIKIRQWAVDISFDLNLADKTKHPWRALSSFRQSQKQQELTLEKRLKWNGNISKGLSDRLEEVKLQHYAKLSTALKDFWRSLTVEQRDLMAQIQSAMQKRVELLEFRRKQANEEAQRKGRPMSAVQAIHSAFSTLSSAILTEAEIIEAVQRLCSDDQLPFSTKQVRSAIRKQCIVVAKNKANSALTTYKLKEGKVSVIATG